MQLWRRQLRSQIADPGLRAKCVPDYVMGCKRVVFSNDWYPALALAAADSALPRAAWFVGQVTASS